MRHEAGRTGAIVIKLGSSKIVEAKRFVIGADAAMELVVLFGCEGLQRCTIERDAAGGIATS